MITTIGLLLKTKFQPPESTSLHFSSLREIPLSTYRGVLEREREAMEEESVSLYRGLRSFWTRKGYVRLNGSGKRKNRMELARLGSNRRRRFWRIKPKLRFFRIPSPKKFFIWLRDAYVKMMLGFANSRVASSGYCGALGNDIGGFGGGFGQRPLKEYDEKMIIEIYKSLVISQGLAPREVTAIGSAIDFRR